MYVFVRNTRSDIDTSYNLLHVRLVDNVVTFQSSGP